MKPIDDIRTFITEALGRDECVDATEIAMLTQRLHPEHRLVELVAMVVEQRYGINKVSLALVREAVASLEAEGRPIEALRGKEEIVAKRIIRLNPDKVAI